MAERGKPIPFATRQEIKQSLASNSQRQTAKNLGVARETVRKYAPKAPRQV